MERYGASLVHDVLLVRTAHWRASLLQAASDYLVSSDPFLFAFLTESWFRLFFLLCCTCELQLENTLKLVWVRLCVAETQLPRMGGPSTPSRCRQKQETTTLKQCQRYVTDDVAMPSLQLKKLGLSLSAKIVNGTSRGIDTLNRHMREMVFQLTEHESE